MPYSDMMRQNRSVCFLLDHTVKCRTCHISVSYNTGLSGYHAGPLLHAVAIPWHVKIKDGAFFVGGRCFSKTYVNEPLLTFAGGWGNVSFADLYATAINRAISWWWMVNSGSRSTALSGDSSGGTTGGCFSAFSVFTFTFFVIGLRVFRRVLSHSPSQVQEKIAWRRNKW